MIYHSLWIMHLLVFLTIILNHYGQKILGVWKVTVNTCVMLFQMVILIYICVELIFPNPQVPDLEIET